MRNLFILVLLSISILSCGTENKPTYKITTTVSPSEGGTITLNPSDGVYSEGETVTITGNPSNGWRFVRWEGDWSSTLNPSTLTMTKDYSVVGVFERRNYPLTINIEGEGEVEERVIQQKTTEYPYQTVVELTPVPDNGWRFVEWSGDLSGSEVPKTITVDGEKTVNVKFERKNYPLTINIVGEGTVTETVLPQRTNQYPFETVVVLESIPSEGWEFVEWSGDLSGNENPQMIVVDEDKEVTVTFQLKTYPVNVTVEGGGTIDIEPQQEVYQHGSTVTLTPTPSEGWEFIEWGGDVDGNSVPLEVTITNELNVIGEFGRKDYPLTVNIVGEGSVSERVIPQRTTQYPFETLVELTSRPEDGWVFYRWNGDLNGNQNPITIEVDETKTVTSEFRSIDELLTIEIIGEGTVQIQQESFQSNPSRRNVRITPIPSDGWLFQKLEGDISNNFGSNTIILNSEKSIRVVFEPVLYLDNNGITVMCPKGMVGFIGNINNIEYEVVDDELLRQRLIEGRGQLNRKVCVSKVTSMNSLFADSNFNQDISDWDVSNVTDMYEMFRDSQFNNPINNWDVRRVTNMSGMFVGSKFNHPINNWIVNKVRNMSWMFAGSQFNQPINNWNVSSVTNMIGMFSNSKFNQPLDNWDVSSVTNMGSMFRISPFNQNISNWNTNKVTDMSWMFNNTVFNQPLEDWDVSYVTDMSFMFSNSEFNQPLEKWDVGNVNDMNHMFYDSKFNKNISSWCVSLIDSEPNNFSTRLNQIYKPVWGTCPSR